MLKKLSCVLVVIALLLCCGCGEKVNDTISEPIDDESEVSSIETKKEVSINPLTGLEIEKDKLNNRPVAVMINNISIAQPVQTGVNKADIVYETEVEGGITRLMAVFKDIESVGQLGPVRSARYPYVDLANGHNAVYIHCGQDPRYCAPHLKNIDDISIDTGTCGSKRISNGLSSEHTLYAFGDKLFAGIKEKKISTTVSSNTPWLDFAKEDEKIALDGGACNKASVNFSTSYNTTFNFDSATGKYTRYSGSTLRTDYVTKEKIEVENVFVLMTTTRVYPDDPEKKHVQVYLDGGDGYYITNGTYTPIKWTKGSSTSSLKFTDVNGNALKVNAGKSWVCIASQKFQPSFS